MIVDYKEIVKELLSEDIMKYKKGIFKNKGDKLTDIEKLLYSDDRLPLNSYLVVGDIVVNLYTTIFTDENNTVYYETTLMLTDKDPITMQPNNPDLNDLVIVKRSFDVFQAMNNHTIYTNLLIKMNKRILKQYPEINNITNI